MSDDRDDKLFQELSDTYLEEYGRELRRELEELEQSGVRYAAPRLDKMVRERINHRRRAPYVRGLTLLAACLLLVIMIPLLLNLDRQPITQGPSASSADSSAPSSSAESAASSAAEAPGTEAEIIPLSFSLPANFTVSAVEQDRGQTIYYLDDQHMDNVVMTLEAAGDASAFAGLIPLGINGREAYADSNGDYNLLALEKDDVLYVLTCRHDINTLVSIGERIL